MQVMSEHFMENLVDGRVAELRNRSAAELKLLQSSSTEIVQLDGADIRVTVYRDSFDNGRHRVVVQGVRERWGGITAKVIAKGFEVASDGAKRVLGPEELYDFT
jgi:hypothetical protein